MVAFFVQKSEVEQMFVLCLIIFLLYVILNHEKVKRGRL